MPDNSIPTPPDPLDDDFQIVIPPDMAPEDALEVIVGLCREIRHPLRKIDHLAERLGDRKVIHLQNEIGDDIRSWVEGIRYILNIIYAYDDLRE